MSAPILPQKPQHNPDGGIFVCSAPLCGKFFFPASLEVGVYGKGHRDPRVSLNTHLEKYKGRDDGHKEAWERWMEEKRALAKEKKAQTIERQRVRRIARRQQRAAVRGQRPATGGRQVVQENHYAANNIVGQDTDSSAGSSMGQDTVSAAGSSVEQGAGSYSGNYIPEYNFEDPVESYQQLLEDPEWPAPGLWAPMPAQQMPVQSMPVQHAPVQSEPNYWAPAQWVMAGWAPAPAPGPSNVPAPMPAQWEPELVYTGEVAQMPQFPEMPEQMYPGSDWYGNLVV